MTTLTFSDDQLMHLTGLLAGVASADGDFDVFEADEIGEILDEICAYESIPLSVSQMIVNFDYETFDEQASCDALHLQTQQEKDAVLALIMRVAHSDNLADAQENAYLVRVAEYLGASFEEIDLNDIIEIVPPPVPGSV